MTEQEPINPKCLQCILFLKNEAEKDKILARKHIKAKQMKEFRDRHKGEEEYEKKLKLYRENYKKKHPEKLKERRKKYYETHIKGKVKPKPKTEEQKLHFKTYQRNRYRALAKIKKELL